MRSHWIALASALSIPLYSATGQSASSVADCTRSSIASGMASGLTGLAGIPKANGNLAIAFLGSTVLACTTMSAATNRNAVLTQQLLEDVDRFKKLQGVISTERLLALGDAPGSQLRFGDGGLSFTATAFSDLSAAWLNNVLGSGRRAQGSNAFDRIATAGNLATTGTTQRYAQSLAAFQRSGTSSLATAISADSAASDLGATTAAYEASFSSESPSSGRSKQVGADLAVRRAIAGNLRLTYAIADLRNMIDEIAAGSGSHTAIGAILAGGR